MKRERKMNRRTFLKVAGATGATAWVGGFPHVVRSHSKEILVGQIHPLTGGLAQVGAAYKAGT
jgi:ABC-type branched-subunit amino acid transport system substrate-binding protein